MKNTSKTFLRTVAVAAVFGAFVSGTAFASETNKSIPYGLTVNEYIDAEAKAMGVTNINEAFRQYALEQATSSHYKFTYDTIKVHTPMTQDEYIANEAKKQGVTNVNDAFRQTVLEQAARDGYTFSY